LVQKVLNPHTLDFIFLSSWYSLPLLLICPAITCTCRAGREVGTLVRVNEAS